MRSDEVPIPNLPGKRNFQAGFIVKLFKIVAITMVPAVDQEVSKV